MATFFRIVQARWASSAMDGEGARLYGGRWNSPGMPAVYLAESRALAALEIVVHAPREVLGLDWSLLEVEVPDKLIERVPSLPKHWQSMPWSIAARKHGDAWLQRGGLALSLPSVVIPEETVLLVNPRSRDYGKLKVSRPSVFRFDGRMA